MKLDTLTTIPFNLNNNSTICVCYSEEYNIHCVVKHSNDKSKGIIFNENDVLHKHYFVEKVKAAEYLEYYLLNAM